MLIFSQMSYSNCILFLFPLSSPDYVVPFPVTEEVTFAIALLLIDIIEDCNLHVKTSLPVVLLWVDKNLSQVTAPGSIKRACLNRVKNGQEIHGRMNMLYTSSEYEIGPFLRKWGLTRSGYAIITNMILNLVWLSQMVPSLNYTRT